MNATNGRAAMGGLRTKLFHGVGAVAYGVKQTGFGGLLMLYYNQVLGLPAQSVGLAIMIAMVFDAVLDPIIGQWSDHLRSRWGRRHPFMYAALLPIVVFYVLLWNPPAGLHGGALLAYLTVVAVLVRTAITFFEIPSSALAPELARGYDERTSFLAFRYLFGVAGGAVMTFAAYRVFLAPTAAYPVGQLNPDGYARYGLVAAGVMGAAILISALGTHRYIPYLRVAPSRPAPLGRMLREMAESLTHGPFVTIALAALFGTMTMGVTAGLRLYFDTYLWGLSAAQIGIFQLFSLLAALLSVITARTASARLGKRTAAIMFLAATVAFAGGPILLRLFGLFPPNGAPALYVLLAVEQLLSSLSGIGCMILFSSMLSDVVEDNELRTGRRSEGLYFAANSFVQKAVSGAGAFVAGVLLAAVHFPAKADPKTLPTETIHQLAAMYLAILAVMSVTAGLFLLRYRITRESHERTLGALAELQQPDGSPP